MVCNFAHSEQSLKGLRSLWKRIPSPQIGSYTGTPNVACLIEKIEMSAVTIFFYQ